MTSLSSRRPLQKAVICALVGKKRMAEVCRFDRVQVMMLASAVIGLSVRLSAEVTTQMVLAVIIISVRPDFPARLESRGVHIVPCYISHIPGLAACHTMILVQFQSRLTSPKGWKELYIRESVLL